MNLLDGKEVAAFHMKRLSEKVEILKQRRVRPAMAVVLAGDDKPSAMYAASIEKAARSIGLDVFLCREPAAVTEEALTELISMLNTDGRVFGILPMMPLPPHLDERRVINAICPEKDADGLTDASIARLFSGRPAMAPCTPKAVMAIADYYGLDLAGREVVIVGRSNVVGKPLAQLCLNRNATVTICHTGTADLAAVTRRGDVVVAAAGKAGLIRKGMIKKGAVVIDVGINRVAGRTAGDVNFDEVAPLASAITPVPGGVGAVTTAMMLENVVRSAARQWE